MGEPSASPPPRYSWTQPSCDACYAKLYPGRQPHRLRFPETETCVYCGRATQAGVYVRIDPAEAPCPTRLKD
jgi:hypothetical protein